MKTPGHEIWSAGLDRVNMSDFARCNWKLIRLAGVDAARRSVMLAAFVSCAWLGRASGCDDKCLWCSHGGDFHHLVWPQQSLGECSAHQTWGRLVVARWLDATCLGHDVS